jgi:hypothetical protein
MIYTYGRKDVIGRFLMYLIFAITASLFFLLYPSGPWGLLFLIVLYFYALLVLTPAFTHHSLTKDWLIIRHGVMAKIEIPLKNIESCGPYTGSLRKLRTGVYSPWKEKSAYIIAEPKTAVIVGLAEPVKLPALLWKKVDSIVFDVEQRDTFLKNLRTGTGCEEK